MSLLSPDCKFIYIIIPAWSGGKYNRSAFRKDILCQIQDASSITLVKAYPANYWLIAAYSCENNHSVNNVSLLFRPWNNV